MTLISQNTIDENLQNAINSISTQTTSQELLLLSLSIDKSSKNRSSLVNTVNDLPDLWTSNLDDGTIFFVSQLSIHVIASNQKWITFDNRIVRDDRPVSSIYAIGLGYCGRIGDNTTINRSSPVSVVGGFTDWCAISNSSIHALGLRKNGTLWAWGRGGNGGRLGDNTTIDRSSPVSVVGGFSDWCAIGVGDSFFSLGLRSNGTLWGWGWSICGAIGNDSSSSTIVSPVSVVGGFTDWTKFSTSNRNSAAIRTNGTLWTWGRNTSGEIGDGTLTNRSSPVSVVGGFSDWCAVSVGETFMSAIRTNGTLWTWGSNDYGELGFGIIATGSINSPISISSYNTWSDVSFRDDHILGLKNDGTLWTWGDNISGELGNNSTLDNFDLQLIGNFDKISGHNYTSFGIKNDGTLWSWGNNTYGRLGDGTTINRSSPVSVLGGFSDWCLVNGCAAIRTNGTLWTWGSNGQGQLGDDTTICRSSPVSVVGGFTDWCTVSSGKCHTAAIRTDGTLWSWGSNNQGQLGDDTTICRSSPVSVVGGFTDWCTVSASNTHNAAIRNNGTLWTWGSNGNSKLGDNSTTNRSSPVSVVGGFTDWCTVSAGDGHTVGIRTNGTAWSWGFNTQGQLGDGTNFCRASPVSVVGGFTDWCKVSTSMITTFHTTLLLKTDGSLWGFGVRCLVNCLPSCIVSPVSIIGGFSDWCSVSNGNKQSAAIRSNGTLWSWGRNLFGVLGIGVSGNRSSPVSVLGGFTDWCIICSNANNSVGIRANGSLWTWGQNTFGQLGDGTTIDRCSPINVSCGFNDWCAASISCQGWAAIRSCR